MTQLNDKTYLSIIENTPLVSIDLIIENMDGEILLGKRLNRPAKGYWFVPGGRILKDETIAEAMKRISRKELGTEIDINATQLLANYEHIYDDNTFAQPDINTHYVVLAYKVKLTENITIKNDEQHSAFNWWRKEDLLAAEDVHQNTKNYFL